MHGEVRCSTRKGFLMFTSKTWTDRNVRWLHFKAPTQCLSSKTRAIRVCCIRLTCTKCSRVHCGEASKYDDLRHPESPSEANWCPKRMRQGCFITGFVWQILYIHNLAQNDSLSRKSKLREEQTVLLYSRSHLTLLICITMWLSIGTEVSRQWNAVLRRSSV